MGKPNLMLLKSSTYEPFLKNQITFVTDNKIIKNTKDKEKSKFFKINFKLRIKLKFIKMK